ncbi:MAG TPA: ATP-binding protein, partial [Chloroflexota bacterium]|nr:ATP-binding protein [Chloroflexota bacterium]
ARFDPPIEAAMYFCCLEALQNAAKHAPGAPVSVHLSAEPAGLTLAVCDQGPGFDTDISHAGTGLQGMLDRMAAVGGTLDVVSVVGQGTTVRGRAPASPTTTKPGSSIDPLDATRKGAGTTIQGCRPRVVGGSRPTG